MVVSSATETRSALGQQHKSKRERIFWTDCKVYLYWCWNSYSELWFTNIC